MFDRSSISSPPARAYAVAQPLDDYHLFVGFQQDVARRLSYQPPVIWCRNYFDVDHLVRSHKPKPKRLRRFEIDDHKILIWHLNRRLRRLSEGIKRRLQGVAPPWSKRHCVAGIVSRSVV